MDFLFEVETSTDTSDTETAPKSEGGLVNRSLTGTQDQQVASALDSVLAEPRTVEGRGSIRQLEPKLSDQEIEEASNVMQLKGTLSELFSIRVFRNNLIIMMICWSFASFAFFLVPLYIGQVDLNLYLISLSLAIAEIISSIICLFITHGGDNRKMLILFCAMSCVGCIGAEIF